MHQLVFAQNEEQFRDYISHCDPRPPARMVKEVFDVEGYRPPVTLVFLDKCWKHPKYAEMRDAIKRII